MQRYAASAAYTGITLLNDPDAAADIVQQYYRDAYDVVRQYNNDSWVCDLPKCLGSPV